MTDFEALLQLLVDAQVEFIIVGGAAATAHGASRLTLDLDIVYRRTPDNIERLIAALAPRASHDRGVEHQPGRSPQVARDTHYLGFLPAPLITLLAADVPRQLEAWGQSGLVSESGC